MKKETIKNNQREENYWVNVHDDSVMIELGFQCPYIAPKDPSIWTKTLKERKMLKTLRRIHKEDMHFHSVPIKHIPVRTKLIIQLKKNKKYPKTTYSIECWQHEIPSILSKYGIDIIAKYSYNDKTYAPTELPFWK